MTACLVHELADFFGGKLHRDCRFPFVAGFHNGGLSHTICRGSSLWVLPGPQTSFLLSWRDSGLAQHIHIDIDR